MDAHIQKLNRRIEKLEVLLDKVAAALATDDSDVRKSIADEIQYDLNH